LDLKLYHEFLQALLPGFKHLVVKLELLLSVDILEELLGNFNGIDGLVNQIKLCDEVICLLFNAIFIKNQHFFESSFRFFNDLFFLFVHQLILSFDLSLLSLFHRLLQSVLLNISFISHFLKEIEVTFLNL
jgi:hypothetical protein